MRVSDLCICDVAACMRDTTAARAGSLMRKYNVGSLPVVDRDDRVIGMVTDRDLLLEVARRNAPPSEIFVEEVMTGRPRACAIDDDILDALDTMRRTRVRRLPVVDEDRRLQGIISIDDIICHAFEDRGREIPYEDVIETLCDITREYQAETGYREGYRESVRHGGPAAGRRYRYRRETPEFEAPISRFR